MSTEIKVPSLPESVADATIATWHKKEGDFVKRDENLVDLETDKVVLEVPAPADGVLKKIEKQTGSVVKADEVLALFEAGGAASSAKKEEPPKKEEPAKKEEPSKKEESPKQEEPAKKEISAQAAIGPSARRLAAEKGINPDEITAEKGGRVTREDVEVWTKRGEAQRSPETGFSPSVTKPAPAEITLQNINVLGERIEKRVPMTRLRARIAERLLAAQHNAAILTTFNEVNLKNIMDLRARYKDSFEKKHGVRLGFMSFFTKAVVEALKRHPDVNASIDGNDIIYHGYFDIGMAVSTERGLVVPVLRDVDGMSFADIESSVANYGRKARDGQLTMEELTGGTFTITNGGVFGSLLSTPILNPPQSAILGMHKIEERPVVENGQIVIRPMMYVALSYDHRIIDGKESVTFLVSVKEFLEEPTKMLLDL